MMHIVALAAGLGLSAGLAPGPLLTLILSETLRYNIGAGVKVALAPIITDLPIILFTLLVLAKISGSQVILAIISFCGAIFIGRLGLHNFKKKTVVVVDGEGGSNSLKKGIIANILSPHPYLFWLSVGMPVMSKAMQESGLQVAAFLVVFYVLLVGSKIVLAVIIGKSKTFIGGNGYRIIMVILGLVLLVLAMTLFYDGLKLLLESSID